MLSWLYNKLCCNIEFILLCSLFKNTVCCSLHYGAPVPCCHHYCYHYWLPLCGDHISFYFHSHILFEHHINLIIFIFLYKVSSLILFFCFSVDNFFLAPLLCWFQIYYFQISYFHIYRFRNSLWPSISLTFFNFDYFLYLWWKCLAIPWKLLSLYHSFSLYFTIDFKIYFPFFCMLLYPFLIAADLQD